MLEQSLGLAEDEQPRYVHGESGGPTADDLGSTNIFAGHRQKRDPCSLRAHQHFQKTKNRVMHQVSSRDTPSGCHEIMAGIKICPSLTTVVASRSSNPGSHAAPFAEENSSEFYFPIVWRVAIIRATPMNLENLTLTTNGYLITPCPYSPATSVKDKIPIILDIHERHDIFPFGMSTPNRSPCCVINHKIPVALHDRSGASPSRTCGPQRPFAPTHAEIFIKHEVPVSLHDQPKLTIPRNHLTRTLIQGRASRNLGLHSRCCP